MYKKLIVLGLAFLMILSVMPRTADAQEQILGPWLWMIVKLDGGGGAAATDIDSLADASDNKVTEEMVAKNSAKEGDTVGDYKWTLAELPANGDINTVVNESGMEEGALDHVTSYALYTYNSAKAQEATMKVGSDDAIKVWVNGEVVHTNAVNRGRSMWQDEFGISLKQGDNLLLVKICEAGGGWGMHVGILEQPFVPVVDILTNWLWMIAKEPEGQGGAAATDVDSLAASSDEAVTEEMIAKIGASEGDQIGDYTWTLAELPQNGNLDEIATIMEVEGPFDDITAYGLITLVADKDMEVQLLGGSDDSIKAWLNGEVVINNAVNRGRSRWQEEVTVNLKQGNNLLLVKVSDRGGGWGMHFGIRGVVETAYKSPTELGTSVEAKGKLFTTWGSLKGSK